MLRSFSNSSARASPASIPKSLGTSPKPVFLTPEALRTEMQRVGDQRVKVKSEMKRSVSEVSRVQVAALDTSLMNENSFSSFPDTLPSISPSGNKSSGRSPGSRSCSPHTPVTSAKSYTQADEARIAFFEPSLVPGAFNGKQKDNRLWYLPKHATQKEYTHTYLNGGAACLPKPEAIPANRDVWMAFRGRSVDLNTNENCINAEAEAEYVLFVELDFPEEFVRPSRSFLKRLLVVFQKTLASLYIDIEFMILPSLKFQGMQGKGETIFVASDSPNIHLVFRGLTVDQEIVFSVRAVIIPKLHEEFDADFPGLKWAEIFDVQPYKPKKPHLRQNFSCKCSICEYCDGKQSISCVNSQCSRGLIYDKSFYKVVGVMNHLGQFYSVDLSPMKNETECEDDREFQEEGTVATLMYMESTKITQSPTGPRAVREARMQRVEMSLKQMFEKMKPQRPVITTDQLNIKHTTYPNYVFELEMTNIRIETGQRIITPIVLPADIPISPELYGLVSNQDCDHVGPEGSIRKASGKFGSITYHAASVEDPRVLRLFKYCRALDKIWNRANAKKAERCEVRDPRGNSYGAWLIYTDCRCCKNRKVNPSTGLPMHKSKCIRFWCTPSVIAQLCIGDEVTDNNIDGPCGKHRRHAQYDATQMPPEDYFFIHPIKKIVRRTTDVQSWYQKMKAHNDGGLSTKVEGSTVKVEYMNHGPLTASATLADVKKENGIDNKENIMVQPLSAISVKPEKKPLTNQQKCKRALDSARELVMLQLKKSKTSHYTSSSQKQTAMNAFMEQTFGSLLYAKQQKNKIKPKPAI